MVIALLYFTVFMCFLTTHQVDSQENEIDLPRNATQPESTNSSDNESDEYRLILELLRRYSNNKILSRPVRNARNSVAVSFNLELQQVIRLDEKSQEITTQVWKTYAWKDEYLQWDPADYGGLNEVRLPSDRIWTPDIVLYNCLDENSFQTDEYKFPLVVSYNGDVTWIPMVIYRSSCPVSVTNFPFDTQICVFKFGSWVYSAEKLDLVSNVSQGFGLDTYRHSSLWEISGSSARTNTHKYECCKDLYKDVIFVLSLRRNPGFHTRVLLVPIIMAALLIPVIFWIPPRRPDRTSLCLSLFGTFCFLLLVVAGLLPQSATDSRIGEFCCLSIAAITIASMLSVIVVNIAQSQKPLPAWTQTVCIRWLSQLLCICPPTGQNRNKRQKDREPPEEITMSRLGNEEELNSLGSKAEAQDSESILKQIARDRDIIAAVLDRLFFIIFICLILLLFIFIFPLPFRT